MLLDSIRWCAVTAVCCVDNACFTGISDFSFSVGLLYLTVVSCKV